MSVVTMGPFTLWAGQVTYRSDPPMVAAACKARIVEGHTVSKYRRWGRRATSSTTSTQVLVVSCTDGRVFTHEFGSGSRAAAIRFVESVNAQVSVAAPAGWYPESGRLRWWDGSAWTEHTSDAVKPG